MNHHLVVTYQPGEKEKQIYQDVLEGLARIVYLADLDGEQRRKALQHAEVIVSKSFASGEIPRRELDQLRQVRLIQLVFAGADNVPFERIPDRVAVACNPGAFAEPLAEHVLGMVLALAKSLCRKHQRLLQGDFDQSGLNKFLRGGICAVIGLGGNGEAVARLMKAVGMKVLGINRRGETAAPVEFIGAPAALQEVLQRSNVVVLAMPLTRKTKGMIGARELDWMKKDAILINVARGPVIDQRALYEHMKTNPDFQVGIDTWWSEPQAHGAFELDYPILELPNLLGSPHIADHVPGMMPKATRLALENVRRYLLGESIRGVLDRDEYV
jgi:phosphoglycerate dehydrogenase-like enzyme